MLQVDFVVEGVYIVVLTGNGLLFGFGLLLTRDLRDIVLEDHQTLPTDLADLELLSHGKHLVISQALVTRCLFSWILSAVSDRISPPGVAYHQWCVELLQLGSLLHRQLQELWRVDW